MTSLAGAHVLVNTPHLHTRLPLGVVRYRSALGRIVHMFSLVFFFQVVSSRCSFFFFFCSCVLYSNTGGPHFVRAPPHHNAARWIGTDVIFHTAGHLILVRTGQPP
jgi:hypothetical protein